MGPRRRGRSVRGAAILAEMRRWGTISGGTRAEVSLQSHDLEWIQENKKGVCDNIMVTGAVKLRVLDWLT